MIVSYSTDAFSVQELLKVLAVFDILISAVVINYSFNLHIIVECYDIYARLGI